MLLVARNDKIVGVAGARRQRDVQFTRRRANLQIVAREVTDDALVDPVVVIIGLSGRAPAELDLVLLQLVDPEALEHAARGSMMHGVLLLVG